MLEETEEYQKSNRSRQLFQNINALRTEFKKQKKFLKNCENCYRSNIYYKADITKNVGV